MSSIVKILITIIITAVIAGVGFRLVNKDTNLPDESSDLQTYNTEQFMVAYPIGFTVRKDDLGIVTIMNDKGKVQIGAFSPGASPGPRPGMTQAQIDEFPKDIIHHGYDAAITSALFYPTGDQETMETLKVIQKSIELKYTPSPSSAKAS